MNAPIVGAVGLGSTLFGGIAKAQGAEQLGQAQQDMYNYQAGLAEINAGIVRQNADYSRDQGERQAGAYGLQAAQRRGATVTALASSGFDVNSGSAKNVRDSQDLLTHMDLDQIRSNAAKTAYDYTTQATQYEDQATLDRMAGANAKTAAKINVESSILSTSASVADKWLQANQLGMFGKSSGGYNTPSINGTLY